MAHINLLDWRTARHKKQQKAFNLTAASAVACTAVLIFYTHIHIIGITEYQEQRNQYLASEIKILDKRIEEINQLETTRKALLDRMQVIQNLQAKRPEIVHLFDELARTLPDGTYLTSVKQSGNEVTITGKAESNARVSAYMRSIEVSPWFDIPKLDVIEVRDNTHSRTSEFTLHAQQYSSQTEQGG